MARDELYQVTCGAGLDSWRVGKVVEGLPRHYIPDHFYRYDPEREAVMVCLDGGIIRMFRQYLRKVKYIYLGPNGEIGVPIRSVLAFDRRIDWYKSGKRIGTTRVVVPGSTGKTL